MCVPGTTLFPAQKLRTIFVAERRSASAVQGPSDVGAAMAMGNSPGMWDRVYDRSFRRREMQSAVDAMELWRQGALGSVNTEALVKSMPVVHTEEIDLCAIDADSDLELVL